MPISLEIVLGMAIAREPGKIFSEGGVGGGAPPTPPKKIQGNRIGIFPRRNP